MSKFKKQKHGEPNPIFGEEERRILSAKDQALASGNSQIIGRNGELPIVEFLRRYLPAIFRIETGFFVTPKGNLSPQIDILVLDSRYPLLSQNKDNSVIAMLHSVIYAIEIKTSIGKRETRAILDAAERIRNLSLEIFQGENFGAISIQAIGYSTPVSIETLAEHFFDKQRTIRHCNLMLLRLSSKEIASTKSCVGAELHWEPITESDEEPADHEQRAIEFPKSNESSILYWIETLRLTHAPLSDFYYRLVQVGYYTLDARNFGLGNIGEQMMEYMSWGTAHHP